MPWGWVVVVAFLGRNKEREIDVADGGRRIRGLAGRWRSERVGHAMVVEEVVVEEEEKKKKAVMRMSD